MKSATAQARRRLRARAPRGADAVPLGGYARARRLWDATELPERERLAHVKGVLQMLGGPNP